MRKIESLAELSDIIKRHFVRGVATNNFLSSSALAEEIDGGRLSVVEQGGNLYIIRNRTSHGILNFYISDTDSELCAFPSNTVVEIPYRERDTALKNASAYLQSQGFSLMFRRQRMSRKEEHIECTDGNVSPALPCELKHVYEIMFGCFDTRTACIPSGEAIQAAIVDQRILVYREGVLPVGLLHYTRTKNGTELRHLAVEKYMQGRGIGGELVRHYLAMTRGGSTVWVRDDNTPALSVYKKYGYTEDGMRSDVLITK
ncbi:MAG: GNAT family N-acetyltransferase [Ruminococcaceae bacterium]|nr:GNAT family N-acetyltransferase [Oscillospiraceae bacterium]